ncbi:MAG: EF-hand domain-containing protein, partial [Pirellula sp.]
MYRQIAFPLPNPWLVTASFTIVLLLQPFAKSQIRTGGENRSGADKEANPSLIKRFDTNGDGQIDEQERRAVR